MVKVCGRLCRECVRLDAVGHAAGGNEPAFLIVNIHVPYMDVPRLLEKGGRGRHFAAPGYGAHVAGAYLNAERHFSGRAELKGTVARQRFHERQRGPSAQKSEGLAYLVFHLHAGRGEARLRGGKFHAQHFVQAGGGMVLRGGRVLFHGGSVRRLFF